MFPRCKLRVTDPNSSKWLDVKLLQANLPDFLKNANTVGPFADWMRLIGEYQLQWTGRWKAGDNSVTKNFDNSYRIGGAPPENCFWGYSAVKRELIFMEFGQWGGGGLGYGELKDEFQVALTLKNAELDGTGIEPSDASGTGKGTVSLGSAIFRPGPVAWTSLGANE